jgi:Bacteriophage CI repressor helix-turn-helix domain
MPRKKVSARDARGIGTRLKEVAGQTDGSWETFCGAMGVPRSTAVTWARRDHPPSVPDATFLLTLARKRNVNLNWLLLDEGPIFREQGAAGTPQERVSAPVEAVLRATEEEDGEDFDVLLTEISNFNDGMPVEEVLFDAAVRAGRELLESARRAISFRRASLSRFLGPTGVARLTREEVETRLQDMTRAMMAGWRKTESGYERTFDSDHRLG